MPLCQPSRLVRELPTLTGARFVAAAAVVYGHYDYGFGHWLGSFAGVAVCFFFVLSGFILTYNYADRMTVPSRQAYVEFLWARVARIYPVYLLTFLMTTGLTLWIWRYNPAARTGETALQLAVEWARNLLLVQAYSLNWNTQQNWLAPAWSVSCEMTFYILFPLILWSLVRMRRPKTLLWAIGGIWLASTFGITLAVLLLRLVFHWHPSFIGLFAYRMPYIRVADFLAGTFAGLWFLRSGSAALTHRLSREGAIWGALAVIAALGTAVTHHLVPLELGNATVFVPPFVILIVAIASGPSIIGSLLSGRVLVRLGEASYSLYLVHWLPIIFLHRLEIATTPMIAWNSMIGSVLASLGLFYAVEDPCRRVLRRRPQVRLSPATLTASLAMESGDLLATSAG